MGMLWLVFEFAVDARMLESSEVLTCAYAACRRRGEGCVRSSFRMTSSENTHLCSPHTAAIRPNTSTIRPSLCGYTWRSCAAIRRSATAIRQSCATTIRRSCAARRQTPPAIRTLQRVRAGHCSLSHATTQPRSAESATMTGLSRLVTRFFRQICDGFPFTLCDAIISEREEPAVDLRGPRGCDPCAVALHGAREPFLVALEARVLDEAAVGAVDFAQRSD
eukprot:3247958-Rhodomonas_salina.3